MESREIVHLHTETLLLPKVLALYVPTLQLHPVATMAISDSELFGINAVC
jgi:hypothetical protein